MVVKMFQQHLSFNLLFQQLKTAKDLDYIESKHYRIFL